MHAQKKGQIKSRSSAVLLHEWAITTDTLLYAGPDQTRPLSSYILYCCFCLSQERTTDLKVDFHIATQIRQHTFITGFRYRLQVRDGMAWARPSSTEKPRRRHAVHPEPGGARYNREVAASFRQSSNGMALSRQIPSRQRSLKSCP